jgi:hypothetical protein
MSRTVRTALIYVVIVITGIMVVNAFWSGATAPTDVSLDDLQKRLTAGEVVSVVINQKSNVVEGQLTPGSLPGGDTKFSTLIPKATKRP